MTGAADENCFLFEILYEDICRDKGLDVDPQFRTNEHRRIVFDQIDVANVFHEKGPRVSLKQWLAWVGGMLSFFPSWTCLLLAICFKLVQDGTKVEELAIWNIENVADDAHSEDEVQGVGGGDGDAGFTTSPQGLNKILFCSCAYALGYGKRRLG